ncbi:MAG: hypothetical protein HZA93_30115 [Verrucomicrobia bacterium]|nr:hypothetical protein [Verrucomicrobiota bacterium]
MTNPAGFAGGGGRTARRRRPRSAPLHVARRRRRPRSPPHRPRCPETLALLAHSYGTQLAQAFVRAHPGSVGRVVFVGSRGLDTARKLPLEADAFLARLAELARADQTVGAKFPDLPAMFHVSGRALRFILAKFRLNDPDNTKCLPKLLDELDSGRHRRFPPRRAGARDDSRVTPEFMPLIAADR